LNVNSERLSLEWVSAAEAPRYVKLITEFTGRIKGFGPLGSSENLDHEDLMIKLNAAKMALEGRSLRMIFARQAKYMKEGGEYREIPSDHKLHEDLDKTLAKEMAMNGLRLYLKERPRAVEELAGLLNISSENVIDYYGKLEKKQLVESDRLIVT
jgi:hypothetical protein